MKKPNTNFLTRTTESSDFLQNPIFEQDFLINELPDRIKDLLHASSLPWLNSLAFCSVYYTDQLADRVWLLMDDEKIHTAVFYCLKKKWGFLKIIDIIGFPDMTDRAISEIIKTHSAHLALVNRLEYPVKPDEHWHSSEAHIFCKSYITIAKLPRNKEAFLSLLGRRHRHHLPQLSHRLHKHFEGDIELRYECQGDIKLEEVIQLEYLNRHRRLSKGKGVDSLLDIRKRQKKRWELTKTLGFMVTFRHKGKIVGGTLNYLYNNKAYMITTAFDPAFAYFSIGKLAIWRTIESLIDKGITDCNFLWGRNFFKTQFLGIEYPWTIHIVSKYKWITKIWKFQMMVKEFNIRFRRLLKTKIGLN